ncbi:probable membrane-associated kinase regulator 2 [Olea europaea var. sylvestris]|uniref:probable membrane-associated kinase regulator 2 n=1 Tax=Olea europaea var. sylvestris TaxID=158386 RepID=UPI000C1D1A28|nr:probable membrane-associated kinase regulator 2 [Olea europaea var. sylvestris]
MEAFTLLKFRRGGSGTGTSFFTGNLTSKPRTATTSSSATALKPPSADTDDAADDDGPYFDLEFTLPDEEEEEAKIQDNEDESEESEDENDDQEGELKFELSKDLERILSPSDELFFKGHLLPIEPSSILLNSPENNSKFPAALVKSATKFRVLLLKLKKSKSEKNEANGQPKTQENGKENQAKIQGNKFFFVKFKVEEVPLVSLFSRDSSSKGNNNDGVQKNEVEDKDSNEKKLTKETVQKYLKKVKPLYIRVSKRYGEKLKIAGHLSFPGGETKGDAAPTPPCAAAEKGEGAALSNVKSQKPGNNLQAGLKVVLKHLGKNRSESSSAPAPVPAPAQDPLANMSSSRRDDSLLQQHDGIQGAILHCKRSFNASREVEPFVLPRSTSDPSHEKSVNLSADSEEAKKKCQPVW